MFVQSKRKNMSSVEISLTFEAFLCRLLGEHMLYVHGLNRQKNWKRIIKRIVTAIEKSIEKNVNSDEFHKSRLRIYIDKLKEAYN